MYTVAFLPASQMQTHRLGTHGRTDRQTKKHTHTRDKYARTHHTHTKPEEFTNNADNNKAMEIMVKESRKRDKEISRSILI